MNLPVFKGENYERWIVQVIFKFQDVDGILNDGVLTLESNVDDIHKVTHKGQRKKDEKGIFLIHQYLDPNVFEKIIDE